MPAFGFAATGPVSSLLCEIASFTTVKYGLNLPPGPHPMSSQIVDWFDYHHFGISVQIILQSTLARQALESPTSSDEGPDL